MRRNSMGNIEENERPTSNVQRSTSKLGSLFLGRWVFGLALLFCGSVIADGDLVLSQRGNTTYRIVVPVNADVSDKAVAKDNPLVNWLVRDAWMSKSSRDLVARFSDATITAGFPLWRLRLLVRTLNPLLFALVYTWQRGADEVTVFEISHEILQGEQYRNSPFAMVINGEGGVRRRLEGSNARLDFPVLEDLVAEGATDYVAMPLRFSDGQLNILTLVSDRPGGFSTEELGQIYEILPTLITSPPLSTSLSRSVFEGGNTVRSRRLPVRTKSLASFPVNGRAMPLPIL